MKIRLLVPGVNAFPTDRPRNCRYCKGMILHRHGTVKKPIKDHRATEVTAHRYKCLSCAKTFRHYPSGVNEKDQSRRTVVLAALMYALGLSCSAASHLLGALGAEVCEMSVWRDAQEAGEALIPILSNSVAHYGLPACVGSDRSISRSHRQPHKLLTRSGSVLSSWR